MADNNRHGFHTVKDSDMKQYKQELREHRLKVLRRSGILLVIALLIVGGIALFMAFRQYTDYDVRSTVARADAAGTQFVEFRGNILKYSNDGAFYADATNELIWNQTYEMSNPQVDICGEYLAIYDKTGTQIYILTSSKLQSRIETTMPIEQVSVAAQGTVAVLMRKEDTAYLELYDKEGKNLAGGQIHGEKGGYPIAIALSQDAIKLGVSMLDISDGKVNSTIAFYNYGSVGQNEIDNCVGVTSYENTVIPEIEFISDERMIAIGDSKILVFEGTQKPQLESEIELAGQAKSIFHNDDYIGVVMSNSDETMTDHLTIYKTNGDFVREKDFEAEYSSVEFMSNDEICILSDVTCDIYTLQGVYKFHYEFDGGICQVVPGGTNLNYTFILKDATERVRLK